MRVLAVSGSLQSRSGNRALIERAAALAPEGMEVVVFDHLGDLPVFDPEADAPSGGAVDLWRQALRASDALLIASPEYGFSLPGSLKNAIDWVIGSGELEGKVIGVTASTRSADRGRRGIQALLEPLRAVSARVVGGRPIVAGEGAPAAIRALLDAIAREVTRAASEPRGQLEVWFDFASTYSYLAVMRAEYLATRAHLALRWRPFLLGPIFQKQGWNDSPFNLYPAKGQHMWRDLERECARAVPAISFRRPSTFPRNSVRAARVAIAHDSEPWIGAFIRAAFSANFASDRDIGDAEVLAAILEEVGVSARDALARAESAEHKPKLRQQTARAERLGIFGAPTFLANGELFWGNDRLERAIEFATGVTP